MKSKLIANSPMYNTTTMNVIAGRNASANGAAGVASSAS